MRFALTGALRVVHRLGRAISRPPHQPFRHLLPRLSAGATTVSCGALYRRPLTNVDVNINRSLGELPGGAYSLFHDTLGRRFSFGATVSF